MLKNTDAAARINERLCAGHGPAAVAAAHSRTLGALSPVVRQAACRVQELLVVLACGEDAWRQWPGLVAPARKAITVLQAVLQHLGARAAR